MEEGGGRRARCSVGGCKAFDGLCDQCECVEKVDRSLRCCQHCNVMACSTHRNSMAWWECSSCPIELCPSCAEVDRKEGDGVIRECDVCEHEFCNECTRERWHADGTPYDGNICDNCEVPPTDEEMAEMEMMHRDYLAGYARAMEDRSDEDGEGEECEECEYGVMF